MQKIWLVLLLWFQSASVCLKLLFPSVPRPTLQGRYLGSGRYHVYRRLSHCHHMDKEAENFPCQQEFVLAGATVERLRIFSVIYYTCLPRCCNSNHGHRVH